MKFTKIFKKLSKGDSSIAGGKGASLGEMTRAKINVPPGFVVLTAAFDKFFEEDNLSVKIDKLLCEVNLQNASSVNNISNKIMNLILNSNFPNDIAQEIIKEFSKIKTKYVAVRSSATAEDSSTASWAGELESYLNTTEKDLLINIKKCWASLFTSRAIFYKFENKLQKVKISVAVVVQEMIQSEISGVCFTVHPVTKDYDQVVIEAGYGLGEAIVGGLITPDTYIVHKNNKIILDKNIGLQEKKIVLKRFDNIEIPVSKFKQKKQKLSDKEIIKLFEICKKIENHYNKIPQDIEWAFNNGEFYILQSRPITTL